MVGIVGMVGRWNICVCVQNDASAQNQSIGMQTNDMAAFMKWFICTRSYFFGDITEMIFSFLFEYFVFFFNFILILIDRVFKQIYQIKNKIDWFWQQYVTSFSISVRIYNQSLTLHSQ